MRLYIIAASSPEPANSSPLFLKVSLAGGIVGGTLSKAPQYCYL